MIREFERNAWPGLGLLVVLPIIELAAAAWLIRSIVHESILQIVLAAVLMLVNGFFLFGFFMVNPNQARVLQLFGDYRGSARLPGLRWANPLYTKRTISVRVRNFETGKLKVNDRRGNPIEIAAIVVWKVVDTAEAAFQVDNYENYIRVQSEAALRNLATGYPYDTYEADETNLVSHTSEISAKLQVEIQERLAQAGIQVLEARFSHLAYAPEIAAAMLRRQQAAAVVAARQKIVEGAVGMVEHALDLLAKKQVVRLDEERRAAMVSNLLVVLCSEHQTQPVVNTGTLYT